MNFLSPMRAHLKNYFVPHEGNDHKPHMLREASVLALALGVVLLFGFSVFHAAVLERSADFTAAVLPAVLVDLANEDRSEQGLGKLAVNPVLEEAARLKAEDMAERGYFAHQTPDGLDPWYWFYRAGYNFVSAGENLAVNFSDSGDVEKAWMNSPGHRANILNGRFSEIGIATAKGKYKGRTTIFVVQMFGRPAALPSVVLTEEETPALASTKLPAETPTLAQATPAASEGAVAGEQIAVESAPVVVEKQATAWEKFLASPRLALEWGYIILGLLIATVLILMILIEVHKQHPRNIFYGAGLLLLIGLLSYLNYLLLSANLVIT